MNFITYNGAPLAVLIAFPNWDTEIKVELTLPTDIDSGLSALETRRVFASSPRYSLDYNSYFASADESTRYRLFLMRLRDELLAVPMWTDQCILAEACAAGATVLQKEDLQDGNSNPCRFGAEWILINEDGSVFEIVQVSSLVGNAIQLVAGSSPSSGTRYAWPAGTFIYPLMFGRFAEQPKPEWITDETTTSPIKIKESSAYIHRLAPFGGAIPTVGSGVPTFAGLPLWSIYPQVDKPKDSVETDVLFKQIGFLREEQRYVYAQSKNRRTLELPFYQSSRDEIAQIERLFVDRLGQTKNFMIPTFRGDMRLSEDMPVAGHPNLVPVEQSGRPGAFTDPDRATNPGDAYIALVTFNPNDPSQPPTIEPGEVVTIDDFGLHLFNAISAHAKDATLVSHLLLVRFSDTKLTWSYRTDGKARSTIKFVELAKEYTAGAPSYVQTPVFLYRFTYQLDEPQYFYFTSYENTIAIPSGDYAGNYIPAPFSHGSNKENVQLEGKLELESFDFAGNPLKNFLPFQLEAPLWIDVIEISAYNLTDQFVVFTGEVWDASPSGKEWKANCLIFGRHLEKNFPNFNVQKVCNYGVYSPAPKCGVNKADFAVAGAILSFGLPATEINVAAGADKAANYFGIGFVEFGSGATLQRRSIMSSAPLFGGAGTKIILNFQLVNANAGDTLKMYPGCNGTAATCQTVFNNYDNFGGFPFVPNVHPSVKAMNAKQTGGGKK